MHSYQKATVEKSLSQLWPSLMTKVDLFFASNHEVIIVITTDNESVDHKLNKSKRIKCLWGLICLFLNSQLSRTRVLMSDCPVYKSPWNQNTVSLYLQVWTLVSDVCLIPTTALLPDVWPVCVSSACLSGAKHSINNSNCWCTRWSRFQWCTKELCMFDFG